jgi:hypothetical protein
MNIRKTKETHPWITSLGQLCTLLSEEEIEKDRPIVRRVGHDPAHCMPHGAISLTANRLRLYLLLIL